MILYSIIIAVYNVEKYLEECLESILAQSYSNWEVILVDDGSTDEGSGKICDAYAQRDERFHVFHRKNEGSLMARRYGLSKSQGDYLLIIDSDDYIHKDLLKSVNEIIVHTQSDLVIYRFKWVNNVREVDSEIIFPEGTIIGKGGLPKSVLWEKLPSCNSLNNLWIKVAERRCIDLEADYSKYAFLQSGTDLMQSLPILERAQKIYFTESLFYYYRYNNEGISSTKTRKNDLDSINKYFVTRNVVMNEKLRYMSKYASDLDKINKKHYASHFKSCMEILISWIVFEGDKSKRMQIIERTLQEPSLMMCKDIRIKSELTRVYAKLYDCYKNNKLQEMTMILKILVIYRRISMVKEQLSEWILRILSV